MIILFNCKSSLNWAAKHGYKRISNLLTIFHFTEMQFNPCKITSFWLILAGLTWGAFHDTKKLRNFQNRCKWHGNSLGGFRNIGELLNSEIPAIQPKKA